MIIFYIVHTLAMINVLVWVFLNKCLIYSVLHLWIINMHSLIGNESNIIHDQVILHVFLNRYMYSYHWLFPVVVVLVLRTESVVGVLELLVVIEVVLKLGIVAAVVNTLRKFGVWTVNVAASCHNVHLSYKKKKPYMLIWLILCNRFFVINATIESCMDMLKVSSITYFNITVE